MRRVIYTFLIVVCIVIGWLIWKRSRPLSEPTCAKGWIEYFHWLAENDIEGMEVEVRLEEKDAEALWSIIQTGRDEPAIWWESGRSLAFVGGFAVDFVDGGRATVGLTRSGLVLYGEKCVVTPWGLDTGPRHVRHVDAKALAALLEPWYEKHAKEHGITKKYYWPTNDPPPELDLQREDRGGF